MVMFGPGLSILSNVNSLASQQRAISESARGNCVRTLLDLVFDQIALARFGQPPRYPVPKSIAILP